MEPLVDAAYAALRPRFDVPFAFLGHSTGALLAYEIARRLRREGEPAPAHLIASGRWAPHLRDPEPPVNALPRDELVAALRRYGGTPEEVLQHGELLDLMLPLLRADFSVGDNYVYAPEPPLEVPITAIGGVADPRVTRESLVAWGEHTAAGFEHHMFPGDHFFLFAARELVLDYIAARLRPVLVAV
jgi:medium-chain acyl-[acyl-carrier-protein] hydrolase